MATPSHGESAYGAPSMDHAHATPARPESRLHGLSAISRPGALGVDETVPAAHRSPRYRTAHPPHASAERMGYAASTALAVVSLIFVSLVAVGSMLASTTVLHLAYPNRRFDDFRALHEPLVLGLLLGLAVFWLLPPHPWAVEPAQSEQKKRRLVRTPAAA
jgi:hypothetical protein